MIESVLPTYARAPMAFEHGKGSWLVDTNGRRYLDAGAGIAVSCLGHAHPDLVNVLKDQSEQLWHTSNLYRIPNQEKLAEKLVNCTFADTVFFTNSGSEAMEASVKMARKYWYNKDNPDRYEIITLNGSFHGRTLGMISASGSEKLTKGFGPLLPGFIQVGPNDLDAVSNAISDNTAAILVEPVLGEGGIVALSDTYMTGLRELCDNAGILLILDEIQCGMGRTGKLFAHEWAGITPDIMAIAKGIGGGFPLGACLATESAALGMTVGTHGSTYGGNPLACAVGCAVIDIIANNKFLQNVRRTAGKLQQGLKSIVDTNPEIFSELRGSGLMLGLTCKVPNSEVIKAGIDECVLTIPGGDNVVRILPPLNISVSETSEIISRIDQAAQRVKEKGYA